MKKIINYEKDIEFKNKISEIKSISIEDHFIADENMLSGSFIVSGEYKINELSVNTETFDYNLPLEYEFDKPVEKDSIKKEIENFEYNIRDDILTIYVDYSIRYEYKKDEIILPKIAEEKEIKLSSIEKEFETLEKNFSDDEKVENIENSTLRKTDNIIEEETELINSDEEYSTYCVHIYREGETIDSIAKLYNTDVNLIKEYNNINELKDKDKIIVPLFYSD